MKSMKTKTAADGKKYRGGAGQLMALANENGYIVGTVNYTYENKNGETTKRSKVYFIGDAADRIQKVFDISSGSLKDEQKGSWVLLRVEDAVDQNGNPMENTYLCHEFQAFGGSIRLQGVNNDSEKSADQDSDILMATVLYVNDKAYNEETGAFDVPMKCSSGNPACVLGLSYPYGKDEDGKTRYVTRNVKLYNSPKAKDIADKFKATDAVESEITLKDGSTRTNPKCLMPVVNSDGSKTCKRIVIDAGKISEFTYSKGDKAGKKGYAYNLGGRYTVIGEVTFKPSENAEAPTKATTQAPQAPAPAANAQPQIPAIPESAPAPVQPEIADPDADDFVSVSEEEIADIPFFNM